jgi:hypothetical protein
MQFSTELEAFKSACPLGGAIMRLYKKTFSKYSLPLVLTNGKKWKSFGFSPIMQEDLG